MGSLARQVNNDRDYMGSLAARKRDLFGLCNNYFNCFSFNFNGFGFSIF